MFTHDKEEERCSVCGRIKDDCKALIDTGSGIKICDRCIKGLMKAAGFTATAAPQATAGEEPEADNADRKSVV